MQPAQKLSYLLRGLVTLVEDEARRNPDFAERLTQLIEDLGSKEKSSPPKRPNASGSVPDVFALYQEKGDEEFRFWIRSLDLETLKRIVRANGFDPGKATRKWTDSDKYVVLIAEQTAARLRRGASFLPPKSVAKSNDDDK